LNTTPTALKYSRAFAVALTLVLIGSSCINSKPVIQTVQVTQLATLLVTKEVTQEVTHIVVVPVIVTPALTPPSTFTPSPFPTVSGSPAPTSQPPTVTILAHSDCMYGPGPGYLYKYSVATDTLMEAIGRNQDGSWVYIQPVAGWNPCWIQASMVTLANGDIDGLPIVYSSLPYSNQYNPPDATAHREGNEVTISWKAVWMSLDDYRGYLIEAWICQGGVQIFDPVVYTPPLESNTGTLSVKLTDEPGCSLPSIGRIYSAQKQGYSYWNTIPWPQASQATPTPGS
jgi:hypothetical protein